MASFVIDEDMSRSIARLLRGAGHGAVHVRDAGLQGSNDATVFQFAQSLNATLITEDLGFADIRAYPLGTHAGIMVLRMQESVPYSLRIQRILEVLEEEAAIGLKGALLIVEPATVRRREA